MLLPWWDLEKEQEYRQFWSPNQSVYGVVPTIETKHENGKTGTWFHHRIYCYGFNVEQKLVSRIESEELLQVASTQPKKKGRGRSKLVIPQNSVLRYRKMRIRPTRKQQQCFKFWMAGARWTFNWALSVLLRQYRIYKKTTPICLEALKQAFVTCPLESMPKKLRWLKDVPCSIREHAIMELIQAYDKAFENHRNTGHFEPPIFRSKRHRKQESITIPTQNFSKRHRWEFFVSSFPDSSTKQDIKEVGSVLGMKRKDRIFLQAHPQGPIADVKITRKKTGVYYMSVPFFKIKAELPQSSRNHLVSQDPGSNPFMTYYSPTRMECGTFGLQQDLDRFHHLKAKIDLLMFYG